MKRLIAHAGSKQWQIQFDFFLLLLFYTKCESKYKSLRDFEKIY